MSFHLYCFGANKCHFTSLARIPDTVQNMRVSDSSITFLRKSKISIYSTFAVLGWTSICDRVFMIIKYVTTKTDFNKKKSNKTYN